VRPWKLVALVLVAVPLAACGGGGAGVGGGPAPAGVQAAAPASAVEQFMGFAKQERFTEMGYLFGSVRGPLAESQAPQRVARRMQAIARVIRHDSFSLSGMVPTPGRPNARTIMVEMRQGRRTVQVPFIVVQGPGGSWLVEQVDLEAISREQTRRS